MPGAKDIDPVSFWIDEEVSCDVNYQAVGDTCGTSYQWLIVLFIKRVLDRQNLIYFLIIYLALQMPCINDIWPNMNNVDKLIYYVFHFYPLKEIIITHSKIFCMIFADGFSLECPVLQSSIESLVFCIVYNIWRLFYGICMNVFPNNTTE